MPSISSLGDQKDSIDFNMKSKLPVIPETKPAAPKKIPKNL